MNRQQLTAAHRTGTPRRRPTVTRVRMNIPLFNISNDLPIACGEDAPNLALVLFREDDGRRTLHAPALGCRVADLHPDDIAWLDELATDATNHPTGGGVSIYGHVKRSTEGRISIIIGAWYETGNLLPVEA